MDHDGYVGFNQSTEIGRTKIKRNVGWIRKELEKHLDDLPLHLQLIESGSYEPDYVEHICQTIEMVKKKYKNWEEIGPPIIRHAVTAANEKAPRAGRMGATGTGVVSGFYVHAP